MKMLKKMMIVMMCAGIAVAMLPARGKGKYKKFNKMINKYEDKIKMYQSKMDKLQNKVTMYQQQGKDKMVKKYQKKIGSYQNKIKMYKDKIAEKYQNKIDKLQKKVAMYQEKGEVGMVAKYQNKIDMYQGKIMNKKAMNGMATEVMPKGHNPILKYNNLGTAKPMMKKPMVDEMDIEMMEIKY